MSTAHTDETLEQTKNRIRSLVAEIAELSAGDLPAAKFYPAVLQRIVDALAAPGGAVWLHDEAGLNPAYQIRISGDMIRRDDDDAAKHLRLLEQLLAQSKLELIPPHSSFADGELANPTDYLLIVAPLSAAGRTVGLIEIFQRPDTSVETQRGYVKFLEHVLKLIADWLKGHALTEVASRQQLWQQADEFARLVHNSLDLRDTAYTIANEARRVIGCDRVSVARMKGRKAKLIAISGQDSIEGRSNQVQALNRLATRVIRGRDPLWYDAETDELPPQIEEAIDEYVDLSHGRTLTVLPIHAPEKIVAGDVLAGRDAIEARRYDQPIIGAIIIEQIETQIGRKDLEGRVDLIYEHACRAMSNSLAHDTMFLMPVWKLLDRATWFFRGSALPKTLAVLTLVAAAIAALFLIQIDFDLEAKGVLKPELQQDIFAHVDGDVEEVYVRHKSPVTAGQPLVKLKNSELDKEIARLMGEMNSAIQQIQSSERELNVVASLTEADRRRFQAEIIEQQVLLEQLGHQLAIQEARRDALLRKSPIDGIVTTWDVEKILRGRPVVTGQVLLNVAHLDSDWYLEVQMPEKRMKHLDRAFAQAKTNYLPVEFILQSESEKTHTGKLYIQDVHQQAEMNGDEGLAVRLKIIPDTQAGLPRLPNSSVTVDVKCGRAAAAYAWFYEIPEWIRANVLF